MMRLHPTTPRQSPRTPVRGSARAFTLIEAVISIAIVGVMYAAALQTVGSSRITEAITADNRRGHELAQQLIAEITPLPYDDPVNGGASLGPSPTENATGNRSLFNDVDDYRNWTASPPRRKDGSTITGFDDWTRSVTVVWIDPIDLKTARSTETNLKRITVSVSRRDKTVATISALRANLD